MFGTTPTASPIAMKKRRKWWKDIMAGAGLGLNWRNKNVNAENLYNLDDMLQECCKLWPYVARMSRALDRCRENVKSIVA